MSPQTKKSTEHRAQSTEHRAQSTEHRAQKPALLLSILPIAPKGLIRIAVLCILMIQTSVAAAQAQWNLTGTNTGSNLRLGTSTAQGFNIRTNGIDRATFTQNGEFGLGILSPRAVQEILYCPTTAPNPYGLIITRQSCSSPILFDPGLSDISPPGPGLTPDPEAPIVIPFSFFTGHYTNNNVPFAMGTNPLLWLREEDPFNFSGNHFNTKFLVTAGGNVGINNANPRAALDVRGANGLNHPSAIIGSRALGTGGLQPNGLFQYYTQQVHFVPNLGNHGYNRISQAGDQGIFFSDGKGADGANLNGALVFAPWSASANSADVGGMRMDKWGNLSVHGKVRCTEIEVEPKWWSDFVFHDSYKLVDLEAINEFIKQNKHLPGFPSEAEICANGLNLGEIIALQQQTIEELYLQVIQLNQRLKNLESK